MAIFNDLSVDLLYVIFSYLRAAKTDLNNVSLTCRLFRDISQRFIVRDATLSHNPAISIPKLFLRTLEERPDLIVHVHRLELNLLREDNHWPEEQHNIHSITRLLTNLREFCFLSRDYKFWHYNIPFPLKWANVHSHDNIRRIDWQHNMTFEMLRICMELPRIETISCRELRAPGPSESTLFALKRSSSVKELIINSSLDFSFEALREALKAPRCLRKLRLSFPDQSNNDSAIKVTRLLEPVQETLEQLEIHDPWRVLTYQSSGQPVDISPLGSLKHLDIPFRYLFGYKSGMPYCPDGLLPHQLCTLNISFSPMRSTGIPSRTTVFDNLKILTNWLGDVESHTSPLSKMPNLRTITLAKSKNHRRIGDLHTEDVLDLVGRGWLLDHDDSGRFLVQRHIECRDLNLSNP